MMKHALSAVIVLAMLVVIAPASGAGLAPQTSDENGVKIVVIPGDLSNSATVWNFEVVLETHTHPLVDEMAEASALVANGKSYPPLVWIGSPPGGHHRQGRLRFMAVTPQPQVIELRIHLNGEPTPRTFKWSLSEAQ